jgi:hypothetical protein
MKYDKFISNLSDSVTTNPKRFWSFFRSRSKCKTIPQTLHSGIKEVDSAPEKAEMLNAHFHSVFKTDVDSELPDIALKHVEGLSTVTFTTDKVLKALLDLDVSKASGPDNLSPHVLKNCARQLAPSLSALFNLSMATGTIPEQWKTANVVPIFKSGDKCDVSNYRPISLLCIVSKVMERCIVDHAYGLVQEDIHPVQHGFVKGKSCCTQLLCGARGDLNPLDRLLWLLLTSQAINTSRDGRGRLSVLASGA